MNKSSRIYIAGHRGMVGSAIQRKLVKEGYQHLITRSSGELDLRNPNDVDLFFKKYNQNIFFLPLPRWAASKQTIDFVPIFYMTI